MGEWKSTACILCELNCGIQVQVNEENEFTRIKGDKNHPTSQGYVCQKASRLNHYQNNRDRITHPLRKTAGGGFEQVSWETAISEIAEKMKLIRDTHGGEKIFYYGGGGQANHLPGAYARATLSTLGSIYTSNALAQEKTGEAWVNGRMLGSMVRGDFEHCEVGIFLGKNPWQSHSIPRTRALLREFSKDPNRTMMVIDPCRTETAEIADYHLAVKPGTDAFLLSALLGVLVQEDWVDQEWIEQRTQGFDQIYSIFWNVPITEHCEKCGIEEKVVREIAKVIKDAGSMAIFEDLGIQMNRHSTLVSYLNKLLWALTGNFGKKGAQYVPSQFAALGSGSGTKSKKGGGGRKSPVVGARIISGLVPCNVITEEILTDHPDRYRAMIVESSNPVHSLADTEHMREAMQALECLVVIDVAMTETAQLADYVLPVANQYEKWEASFFNFEFPNNHFHLRQPVCEPPETVLTEPEIHTRLVEALGAMPQDHVDTLNKALEEGRDRFQQAFFEILATDPQFMAIAPVVLYRTLGQTLPDGAASASALWALAHLCAMSYGDSVRRAGIEGEGLELGENLFEAVLSNPSGIIFSVDDFEVSLQRIRMAGQKIQLALPDLFDEIEDLANEESQQLSDEFPFVLSAGERRSYTANTIYRDPNWRKKDIEGALRLSPIDADALGIETGARVKLITKKGAAEVLVEISDRMQVGHVSLPNGLGLEYPNERGEKTATGVAPNELTSREDRDWLAGTPWHKYVPARIEVA